MIVTGIIFAGGLALAGAWCAWHACMEVLDQIEERDDETNRSFPDLGHHLSDRERGGGVRPGHPAQSAGTRSRQTFAAYHRQLRREQTGRRRVQRDEIRKLIKGNHVR